MKKINLISLATIAAALLFAPVAHADTVSVNFENPPYTVGNINGQNGWNATGAYDHGVVSSPVISGSQSFRISNAITSGSFDDWVFSKSLLNEAGETGATNAGFSGGTRQSRFEAQWDIKSTVPTAEQPGLQISISPDRGDGSRASFIRVKDLPGGLTVEFVDVTGTTSPVSFNTSVVASNLSRSTAHTIKLSMDFVDGPSNDVVKVYVDGVLVKTGTSWENYYRFDTEASAEQNVRTVDSLIIQARESGGTAPDTLGKGFLIDNLSLMSGPIVLPTVKVTIDKFIGNSMATAVTANSSSFPMNATWNATNIGAGSGSYDLSTVGFNSPTAYEAITADMTVGADYTTSEITGGSVVGANCAEGKPYALDGYTAGDTLNAAQTATKSSTPPNFTNLQNDKFVIVWNKVCETPTPTPTVITPTPIANLPLACTGMTFTNVINGTNKSETLNGTSGNDLIFGGNGSDFIDGKGGNDCIVPGNGSSVVLGGSGDDVIVGGNSSDSINGEAGMDKIYGNNGSDYLVGGADADQIWGGNGSDLLSGDGGADKLYGEGGSDVTNGGAGSDTCVAESKNSCEL